MIYYDRAIISKLGRAGVCKPACTHCSCCPTCCDMYVRVGRWARRGARGCAICTVTTLSNPRLARAPRSLAPALLQLR